MLKVPFANVAQERRMMLSRLACIEVPSAPKSSSIRRPDQRTLTREAVNQDLPFVLLQLRLRRLADLLLNVGWHDLVVRHLNSVGALAARDRAQGACIVGNLRERHLRLERLEVPHRVGAYDTAATPVQIPLNVPHALEGKGHF